MEEELLKPEMESDPVEKAEEQVSAPKKANTARAASTKSKASQASKAKKDEANVVPAPVQDIEKLIEEVKAEVKEAELEASKYAAELAGKSTDELRQLHSDALYAESEAKRYLHLLRLRAASLATTVGHEVDHEIMDAKVKVAEAASYVSAIEDRLEGEVKDIWGTYFRK